MLIIFLKKRVFCPTPSITPQKQPFLRDPVFNSSGGYFNISKYVSTPTP